MYRMLILNMTVLVLNMRMKQLRSASPGCQDNVQDSVSPSNAYVHCFRITWIIVGAV
jgi:hypothetical protein